MQTMKLEQLALPEVLLLTPTLRRDERGSFHESWQQGRYRDAGLPELWVQDNVSRSQRGVLRGLHFQHPRGQAKLVSVMEGEILDVAVDVRRGSPNFGRAVTGALSSALAQQLFIPAGFAHGFVVTSDEAVVHYKCSDYYVPECEKTISWNDPLLAIDWPIDSPILSARDKEGRLLRDLSTDELPAYHLEP